VLTAVKSFDVNVINMITVSGSQQVQLEVNIAEVSKSGSKQMGLGFINNSDWNIGLFPSGSFSGASAAVGDSSGGVTSGLDLASPFASAFQLAVHSLSGDTVGILSILKGQGLARILATPTLVTMSGQEADFLVGGEFPVPVPGDNGSTNVTFKEFGILLRFTPMVVDKETITIRVEPEVSSVDYSLGVISGGVSVPGISTRRGATTLQLKDGQSFVMAGLLKEESATTISKFPFLGDIPIIGSLFTSKSFQKSESELMIMVTPRLVRALNADELPPLPGAAERSNVSDVDFFLRNLPPERPAQKSDAPVQPEAALPQPQAAPHPRPADQPPVFTGATGFAD
jgi:pilus assembly protein CpaC